MILDGCINLFFMKKLLVKFLLCGIFFPFIVSCIKDEAPNAECDIERVILNNADILGVTIGNDRVVISAKPTIDLTSLSPEFILTPGATIYPESGTNHDFSTGVTYTVTSEDRKWSKDYEIKFNLSGPKTKYNFENFRIENNPYCIFYEINQGNVQDWASGNSGFALSGEGTSPELYPTYYSEDAKEGRYALKLETKSTGSFGEKLKKPIASGSLFLGSFNTTSAIINPLKATQFGKDIVFSLKPLWLKGWYKYKAGANFTNKESQIIADRKDIFDVYAVLFDVTDLPANANYLTGDNVLTSDAIVAIARLDNGEETDEYIEFNIPFEYRQEYDKNKQEDYKYRLTIVFSSSKTGDVFEGAVGSVLLIDDVELICEE